MSNILISICIPTFNRGSLLESLLKKLHFLNAAKFANCEVVVSDNGSQDGTQEICERYQQCSKYQFTYNRYEKNLGVAKNIIGLYSMAKGQYFLFIGDDDVIQEDKLSEIINILESRQPRVLISDPESKFYCKSLGSGEFLRRYFYLYGNTYHGIVNRDAALVQISIIEDKFGNLASSIWPQTIIASLVAVKSEYQGDILLTSCLVGTAPYHSELNIKDFMYYARTLTSLYQAGSVVTLISGKRSPLIFFYSYGLMFTVHQAYQMLVQRVTQHVTDKDLQILSNNVNRSNVFFDFPLRFLVYILRSSTLTLCLVYLLRLLKGCGLSETRDHLNKIQDIKVAASKGKLEDGQRFKNYWDAE